MGLTETKLKENYYSGDVICRSALLRKHIDQVKFLYEIFYIKVHKQQIL